MSEDLRWFFFVLYSDFLEIWMKAVNGTCVRIHLEEFSICQKEIRQLPILPGVSIYGCHFAYYPSGDRALLNFQKHLALQEGWGMVVFIQDMNDYQSARIPQRSVLRDPRQNFKPVRLCRFIV